MSPILSFPVARTGQSSRPEPRPGSRTVSCPIRMPSRAAKTHRRSVLTGSVVATAFAGLIWKLIAGPRQPRSVFIGTQQQGPGAGIQAATFDEVTGRMKPLGLAAEVERPTWLVSPPGRCRLYAVSEVGNAGDREGEVLSFAVEPTSSRLRPLGRTRSGGGGATHLVMNQGQDTLFVANFGGGTVATLSVGRDGVLTTAGLPQPTAGSGPHRRQKGPHPHGVTLDPSGRFLLVPDMGADRVFIFRHHRGTHRLSAAPNPFLQMPAGSGPRLLLFGRKPGICYLLSELSAELFVLRWDPTAGRLTSMARVALDRPGAEHAPSAAALAISRDGRRLYASNRGSNQIQVYAIDRWSGLITEIQRIDANGLKPWSVTLSPAGTWLLVANQGSNALSVFKVDADGRLAPSDGGMDVPSPTSIVFAGRRARVADTPYRPELRQAAGP